MNTKDIKVKRTDNRLFRDWILPIIGAIILALVIKKFIFIAKIPSDSMKPTLTTGDRLIVKKIYDEDKLKRGDVIVFYSDELEELLIKRLIGMPGDKIIIDNGVVEVNGEVLNEDYIGSNDNFTKEYIVPLGKYFFLGDNRERSNDSRIWINPFIDLEDIVGKAVLKIYPLNDFELIK